MPRRRTLRNLGIGVGVVVLLAAAWLGVTILLLRRELSLVAEDVAAVRVSADAGNLVEVRGTLGDLLVHAERARRLSAGPAWWLASRVPRAGAPLRTVQGVARVVDDLGRDAMAPLLASTAGLDPDHLRLPDGRIDVDRLAAVAPAVHRVSVGFAAAERTVRGLPAATGISAVDKARASLLGRLSQAVDASAEMDRIVNLLPAMLGRGGDRNYLLVFQNEAEARGTGGLPGAFAMASAVDGRISFAHMDSDRVLAGISADVALGPEYDQLYATSGVEKLVGNANLNPHFPYAAQIWASMWQRRFHQSVDGVIALDPTVLGYLLRATGPATLTDGTSVDADDVVRLTEQSAYAKFPGLGLAQDVERRKFLVQIEQAVVQRLSDLHGRGTTLVAVLRMAAAERRLLVWSSHPAEQAELMSTDLSGAVPLTTAPYVGLSIVNDGGNKLDYYLDRGLLWERTGCGAARKERVTVTLTNNAPARGLSPLVTLRSDTHTYPIASGDNRLLVSYLATSGALLDSATLDGVPAMVGSGELLGHPVLTMDVELPRGTTRRIELEFTEPASASAAPIILRQPLVNPLTVRTVDRKCSGAG
jgi:hypothetical protein